MQLYIDKCENLSEIDDFLGKTLITKLAQKKLNKNFEYTIIM